MYRRSEGGGGPPPTDPIKRGVKRQVARVAAMRRVLGPNTMHIHSNTVVVRRSFDRHVLLLIQAS